MAFNIRMGIPEMAELWNRLQTSYRNGTINKKDEELYKKWGNAIKKLAADPQYPSLNTHEIAALSKRYGMKVWQSYLEKSACYFRYFYGKRRYGKRADGKRSD